MVQELFLRIGGVEYSEELGEAAQRVGGQTTLLVPEGKHLQPKRGVGYNLRH